MAYIIKYSTQFKKSLKKCQKRGLDMEEFRSVALILTQTGTLPKKYKPHLLSGNYKGCWECHIKPDWLLIWTKNDKELILLFIDTGTHSDLFG